VVAARFLRDRGIDFAPIGAREHEVETRAVAT
jgi:hypothetical protein